MAFNDAPSQWIASWSEDGTSVTFDIADVTDLTAAEADGTTGDMRACMLRLLESFFQHIDGLAAADQPGKLTISRSRYENSGSIVYQYTTRIFTDVDTTVTAE